MGRTRFYGFTVNGMICYALGLLYLGLKGDPIGVQGFCESNSDCAPKELCLLSSGDCVCLSNVSVTDYSHCNAEDGRRYSGQPKTVRCKTGANCRIDEFCADEGASGCQCTPKSVDVGRNKCTSASPSFMDYIKASDSEYDLFMIGLPIIFCGVFIPILCCVAVLAIWYRRRYQTQRRRLEAAVSSGEPAPALSKLGVITPESVSPPTNYQTLFQQRYEYGMPPANQYSVPGPFNVPPVHHGYGDRPSYPTNPY